MLQVVRSCMLLGATMFNFLAFKYLRLDQALVIMFSIPLMVAVLAGPMLGEWVGPRRWAAIGVGFVGVLLVARPGFGFIHPAALLSVVAAAFSALYAIMTRTLARFDSNETTLFYSNLVGALALLPLMPFAWTTPSDPLHVVIMMFLRARQRRTFSADRGSPPYAGVDPGAVHLHATDLGSDARLYRVRRRS